MESGFLLLSTQVLEEKTGWELVCVHRITGFIAASVSTLVRPAGSENPEMGGVIISNLACSELRVERKWGRPGAVMAGEVQRKGFDFSSPGEWVPFVKESGGSNPLCLRFPSLFKCCTYVKQSPFTMKAGVLYLITVSWGSSGSWSARIGWLFNGACQGNWLQMGKWDMLTHLWFSCPTTGVEGGFC